MSASFIIETSKPDGTKHRLELNVSVFALALLVSNLFQLLA